MAERGLILAINAGSSSVKFALFGAGYRRHLSGELEGIGAQPRLPAKIDGRKIDTTLSGAGANDVPELIRRLVRWIETHAPSQGLAAIGHRVATGGLAHAGPVRITSEVLEGLRALVPLAPLHQRRNLEPIEVLGAAHPGVPQVACFDTAFHRTLQHEAGSYALPQALSEAGARRYGFHGLSYEYIARQLPRLDARAAAGRTIVCHLGSGASLCAMQAGRSIETTMGFSSLSGLVMATRPGDLDPGLMIWLMRERGMTVDAVQAMLYRDSGLKGVSGRSGDMRGLLSSSDPHAAEAVDLFVYRTATEIGRLAAALGGIDALVFTAGIGEHAAAIREAICRRCGWLGLHIDDTANRQDATRISLPDSAVSAWVVPTDEERMVALHTAGLLSSASDPTERDKS